MLLQIFWSQEVDKVDMMLDIWIAYGNKKIRDVYGEKLKVTEMI